MLSRSRAWPSADEPLADQKFDQAQKLREAGKLDESCKLFRESLKLNPNAIGTLLNVARCDEEQGKIASAVRGFTDARQRAAEQHLAPQARPPKNTENARRSRAASRARIRRRAAAGRADHRRRSRRRPEHGRRRARRSGTRSTSWCRRPATSRSRRGRDRRARPQGHRDPEARATRVIKNPRRLVGKILTFVGGGAAVASVGLAVGAKIDNDAPDRQSGAAARRRGDLHAGHQQPREQRSHARQHRERRRHRRLAVAASAPRLWYFSPNHEQPPY